MYKTASNIILALMMVILTTGITITQHYCHNRLQDTGIFTLADGCKEQDSCCGSLETTHCKSEHVEQKDCCKNENVFVKFISQFTITKFEQITLFIPYVALIEIFSFDEQLVSNPFSFLLKHPPSSPQNIQALFSSFLL